MHDSGFSPGNAKHFYSADAYWMRKGRAIVIAISEGKPTANKRFDLYGALMDANSYV
jgi:hypothetical protein